MSESLVEARLRRLDLAFEANRRGDREGAGSILDPLLAETPDLARAWMLKGMITDQADLPRQLSLLEQAVAASPSDPEPWYNLGVCLAYAGRWREAAVATRRSVALDPLHPEALANGCELERLLGAYDKALDLADRRVRLGDAPWEVHLRRGLCLIALGRMAEAESAVAEALETAAGSVDVIDLVRRSGVRCPPDQLEAMLGRLAETRAA